MNKLFTSELGVLKLVLCRCDVQEPSLWAGRPGQPFTRMHNVMHLINAVLIWIRVRIFVRAARCGAVADL